MTNTQGHSSTEQALHYSGVLLEAKDEVIAQKDADLVASQAEIARLQAVIKVQGVKIVNLRARK